MIRLVLDKQGEQQLDQIALFFADLQHRMPDAHTVREAQRIIEDGYAENFANEGSARGKWPALAPRTVADRIRRGYSGSHPILVRSGSYRSSWVGDDYFAVGHIRKAANDGNGWWLEVGSDDYRVMWHERGTRHMPARPVSAVSDTTQQRLSSFLDAYYFNLDIAARGLTYDLRINPGRGGYRDVTTGRFASAKGKR